MADRKKLIIEAAAKSFSEFGYKATTMDQVARRAGVGKGTIYTFFKNKEDLLQYIMESLIAEMKHSAEETIDERLTFNENVHRALYKMLEYRFKHQLAIKLYEEVKLGTPEVVEALRYVEESILNYISQYIEEAIRKQDILPCDPKLTAFIILKMYIALIFDWEKNHPPLTKEEISKLFELYIFKGLSMDNH
ncbi:putative HTH-type transcriptional regulator YhgD [Weizmannia acidilactici]|uniref:HTH-type transcriptional regulator YhgD n=1 Tax=Weizmannia acidilactici TaxID=2607726 RepID=A0A5J4JL45_9BACI|nr:TetR/AcrR family transcriptional regulator [Weizmannia acidilactici]GER68271.1 putative HTH-type transcriptional regulator YhgD [Weizmannia acidilactici]GER71350.1 putative HTH-type transcriptional regulator YhgD [Weizmannia acidilactici]GER72543.1 putative HTH-type transcriptional regulator YhgD [Weizmannia acidilactici]